MMSLLMALDKYIMYFAPANLPLPLTLSSPSGLLPSAFMMCACVCGCGGVLMHTHGYLGSTYEEK